MTTVRIRIEAEAAAFDQQMAAVQKWLDDINAKTRGGAYKLDTAQAERDIKRLETALTKLATVRDLAMQGGGLDSGQLKKAGEWVGKSSKAVEKTVKQAGLDANDDFGWIKTSADEYRQLAQKPADGRVYATGNLAKQQAAGVKPPDGGAGQQTSGTAAFDQLMATARQKLADVENAAAGGAYKIDMQQAQDDFNAIKQLMLELARTRDDLFDKRKLSFGQLSDVAKVFKQHGKALKGMEAELYTGQYEAATQFGSQQASISERQAATARQQHQDGDATARQRQDEQSQRDHRIRQMAQIAASVGGAAMGGGGMFASMGGALGLIPGPAGAAAGLVGGMVGGKLDSGAGNAEQEAIAYHNLRNSLGGVGVDFDGLRDTVRSLTEGLGVTDNEAVALARQFAATAAATPDPDALAGALRDAVSFARGYGMEPQLMVDFSANQRLYGATPNESDNRRLAVQIAEAATKGGASAKMPEMVAAITQFTQRTAALSLSIPDVSQFISLMGAAMASGYPGLAHNPQGAANLFAQADQGFRGMSGEGEKMFFMQALQANNKNITGWDINPLLEGGLFASNASTYSDDSPFMQLAISGNDTEEIARLKALQKDTTPNIETIFDHIKRNVIRENGSYNTTAAREYAAGELHIPQTQAATLLDIHEKGHGFGELEDQLKQFGIDPTVMNDMGKLGPIAELLMKGDYDKQFTYLKDKGAIKPEAAERFNTLKNDNPEAFKKEIMALTLKDSGDQGKDILDVNTRMANSLQDLATHLIPLTLGVKEGIVNIARFLNAIPGMGNEKTKAFIAEQDMLTYASRNKLTVTGFNADDKPLEPQEVTRQVAGLGKIKTDFDTRYLGMKGEDESMETAKHRLDKALADYESNPGAYLKETPQLIKAMRHDFGLDQDERAVNELALTKGITVSGKNAAGKDLPGSQQQQNYARLAEAIEKPEMRLGMEQYFKENPDVAPKEWPELTQTLKEKQGVANTGPVGQAGKRYTLPLSGITQSGKSLSSGERSSALLTPYLKHFMGIKEKGFGDDVRRRIKNDKTQARFHKDDIDANTLPFLDFFEKHADEFEKNPEAIKQFLDLPAPELRQQAALPEPEINKDVLAEYKRHVPRGSLTPSRLPGKGSFGGGGMSAVEINHYLNNVAVPELYAGQDVRESSGYQNLSRDQRKNAGLIIDEAGRQGHPDLAHYLLGLAMAESSLTDQKPTPVLDEAGNVKDYAHGLFQVTGATAKTLGVNPGNKSETLQAGVKYYLDNYRNNNALMEDAANPQANSRAELATGMHLTGPNRPAYKKGQFPSDSLTDSNSTNAKTHAANMKRYAVKFADIPKAKKTLLPPPAPFKPMVDKQGLTPPKPPADAGLIPQLSPLPKTDGWLPFDQNNDADKIPDALYKQDQDAKREERDRQLKVKYSPLALDITLRDRYGVPMTDHVVSSQFGAPRPSSTA